MGHEAKGSIGNPWYLYDYRKENDFVEISNINWNDLLFGNICGEEDALADYKIAF